MESGSIFLITALLLVVGLFIGKPLYDHKKNRLVTAPARDSHLRSALLAEQDRILTALWELDFDYTLGKIPEEDYPGQRKTLLHQGANILRQLDALQSDTQIGEAETRLEAVIAARRMAGSPVSAGAGFVSQPDDEFEVMLANRRRLRQEKAGGFCPQCGKPVQKSDRFCPKCGAKTV